MLFGQAVVFNLATTVSFAAAATCGSLTALGTYLGQARSSRHFRHVAAAGFAATLFCLMDGLVAGGLSDSATLWAGRISLFAAAAHGVAWLGFLAAWDRRPPSRVERVALGLGIVAGLAVLVPGWAVGSTVTERTVPWAHVTYHDPEPGPLALPCLVLIYATQLVVTAGMVAFSRRNRRARGVALGLIVFCLVIPIDSLSGLHIVELPYLADPALALVFLAVGAVVTLDAAESGAKTAELERARVALAERENLAALGQLAAVVAHEVRNPVAIIFGALANLERAERSEDDAKLLGIVGEEAERLKQLVARLLEAVRPFELQYTRREAGAVVRAAIGQVTTGSGVAPSQVELETAPSEEVECDEVLLGQAISNLVQNALVATGRRSPVRVRASVEPGRQPTVLRIEVADDGDGVAVDVRPRLFTPFFTTRATGTGLGLALVRRIAGAHGGTVDFEPPSDGGASFVLRVPLRARDATPKLLLGDEVR